VNSAIYEGTIRHRRFAVRSHELRHRLALAYVDLDELPQLLGGRLLRRGVVRFRRSDYLPGPGSLAAAARELSGSDGPIRVLTNLRSFGHCFNPVSFFYCHDNVGILDSVIAEVTNTPWGERHAYVLRGAGNGRVLCGDFGKLLHVSPFMGMDHAYELRATAPGETLSVHVESRREGAVAFDATLRMRRRPFTARVLADVTARYPLATARTLGLIYAHAVVLKVKGVPVYSHPAASS
jgi:uncharacterized protein